MSPLIRRLASKVRFLSQWRCVEPVLVFESDDWGLERNSNPDEVSRFGTPDQWAFDQTESVPELSGLYDVLARYVDSRGRRAGFTANFIRYHTFDFLRGSEPYKSKWTDKRVQDVRAIAPLTMVGRLGANVARLQQVIGRHGRLRGVRAWAAGGD